MTESLQIQSAAQLLLLAMDANVKLVNLSAAKLCEADDLLGDLHEQALRTKNPAQIIANFRWLHGVAKQIAEASHDGSRKAERAQENIRRFALYAVSDGIAEAQAYRAIQTEDQRQVMLKAVHPNNEASSMGLTLNALRQYDSPSP